MFLDQEVVICKPSHRRPCEDLTRYNHPSPHLIALDLPTPTSAHHRRRFRAALALISNFSNNSQSQPYLNVIGTRTQSRRACATLSGAGAGRDTCPACASYFASRRLWFGTALSLVSDCDLYTRSVRFLPECQRHQDKTLLCSFHRRLCMRRWRCRYRLSRPPCRLQVRLAWCSTLNALDLIF